MSLDSWVLARWIHSLKIRPVLTSPDSSLDSLDRIRGLSDRIHGSLDWITGYLARIIGFRIRFSDRQKLTGLDWIHMAQTQILDIHNTSLDSLLRESRCNVYPIKTEPHRLTCTDSHVTMYGYTPDFHEIVSIPIYWMCWIGVTRTPTFYSFNSKFK